MDEELKPVIVGPVSTWDMAAWMAATPGYAIAFDTEWERIKLDFKFATFDDEVNAWKRGGDTYVMVQVMQTCFQVATHFPMVPR